MGKSNKKVKNDRINMLRKQYDAYLEEDKKRKERNEYILGKLDKMRSATAPEPISTKVSYDIELNPPDIYMRQNLSKTTPAMYDNYSPHSERQNVNSGLLNKIVDESAILKEISKKYILIPKRRTSTEVEYTYHKDVIDDIDWRNKYNILDNLKKQEKEGLSEDIINKTNNITVSPSKHLRERIHDKESYDLKDDINQAPFNGNKDFSKDNKTNIPPDERSTKYNEVQKSVDFEIPDINTQSGKEAEVPLQSTLIPSNKELTADKIETFHIPDSIENSTHSFTNGATQPYQNVDVEKEQYFKESEENNIDQIPQNSYQEIYPECEDASTYDQTTAVNKINENNVENSIAYAEVVPGVDLQRPNVVEITEEKITPNANTEILNPIDTDNAQNFISTEQEELYNDKNINPSGVIESDIPTYDTNQHYDPIQDNIPVVIENTEHTPHVDHDSEINAFETEQKDMFYTEQTGDEAYAYNQEHGNTGEYTAEGYEQNEQYAYYEGAQQQQAYETNVNEHEESTERYDPHYNQQYEGHYENQPLDPNYENTNIYDQQEYPEAGYENQQFENIANYENQQENVELYQQENNINEVPPVVENVLPALDNQVYDQHIYTEQPDTQERIEQQLIAEEGYIENSSINTVEVKNHVDDNKKIDDMKNVVEPGTNVA